MGPHLASEACLKVACRFHPWWRFGLERFQKATVLSRKTYTGLFFEAQHA